MQYMIVNANPDSYNIDNKCEHGETFHGNHAAQTQESWHQKVSDYDQEIPHLQTNYKPIMKVNAMYDWKCKSTHDTKTCFTKL